MSRQAFDIAKALPAAWKLLWADNLRKRIAGEDYSGNTTYLTATDLEHQVRRFAQEQQDGKPWGSSGRQWGSCMSLIRISTGRPGGLFAACRRWLLDEVACGRLEGFNHGRGHISGMRFRPRGKGLNEQEKATVERHKRERTTPRPVHISASGTYGGRPLCVKPPAGFRYRSSRYTRTTSDREDVTCPRCLKKLGTSVDPYKEDGMRNLADPAQRDYIDRLADADAEEKDRG